MTLPSSVRIGPLDFIVTQVDDLKDDHATALAGQVYYPMCQIRIEEKQSEQMKMLTLWHEIIHTLMNNEGLNQNEKLTTVIANGVAQVLRDNPALRLMTDNLAYTR